MEQVSISFVLTIAGTLITILLGIIAYFMKRFIQSVDHLTDNVKKLQIAFQGNESSCIEKHKVINARFRELTDELSELQDKVHESEKEIIALQSKQKI